MAKLSTMIGFTRHNHKQCVTAGLKKADAYCEQNKLRFTAARRRALGILLENHSAMGAYDLLERLNREGLGSKPTVAYRALGFLLENGFVHRIEKLNAYIACAHYGADHEPAFFICTDCGAVAEAVVGARTNKLAMAAKESGFTISHAIMEAEGQCPQCQQSSAQQ